MSELYGQVRILEAELRPNDVIHTRTVLYTAKQRLECAVCEGTIWTDDLFTLALAQGHGRVRVPHCCICRPWVITDGPHLRQTR